MPKLAYNISANISSQPPVTYNQDQGIHYLSEQGFGAECSYSKSISIYLFFHSSNIY